MGWVGGDRRGPRVGSGTTNHALIHHKGRASRTNDGYPWERRRSEERMEARSIPLEKEESMRGNECNICEKEISRLSPSLSSA